MRKRYYCYHSLSFHISETTYVHKHIARPQYILLKEMNFFSVLNQIEVFLNANGNLSAITFNSINKV